MRNSVRCNHSYKGFIISFFSPGNVVTLKGLNLRNCPISFPPQDIVHQGVQGILQYLRSAMAKRQISMRKAPPGESKAL